jgi:ATP-dependent RNA circularization protein (DNA/RNA ligase family)
MFVKYDKIRHIFPVTSKHNLDKTQLKRVLGGWAYVEEKMDGSNVGIIRHTKGFALQKRNSLVGPSVHPQFDYFYNWSHTDAYERIMAVEPNTLIYGELLYAIHHIYYATLPEYFLVFDVKKGKKWLNRPQRNEFCQEYGFHQVPLIAQGVFEKDDLRAIIPTESRYGPQAEGVVVKRYTKHGYFRGKIVKPGFIKELEDEEHWSNKEVIRNGLRPQQ